MALLIETFVICDCCGISFGIETCQLKGMQQRALARESGWVYHGKDICPQCRVKNKEGNDFKHTKNRTRRNTIK